MRTTLFCAALSFIMGLGQLNGQNPSHRDSLLQVWQNPDSLDKSRLKALVYFIHVYHYRQHPDSVAVYGRQLEAYAREVGSQSYESLAQLLMANTLLDADEMDAAIPLFQEALAGLGYQGFLRCVHDLDPARRLGADRRSQCA